MSELRSAAVLFADIAASTELRANLGDRRADASLDGLIGTLGAAIRRNAGQILKSDGDDVVAVFEHPVTCVNDAAHAAMECQQAARAAGHKLYVGLHAGVVEFREVFGRPDISGLAVNLAARLHKLVPDLPGHIFMAADTVTALSRELQDRVRPYGARLIKGVGPLEVHTLDWDEAVTVMPTRFALPTAALRDSALLGLEHQGRQLKLPPSTPPIQLGRDRNNDLHIADEQQHVSSRHLKILCRNGAWIVQDISRNGTWLRFDGNPHDDICLLGEELKLIGNGRLCLGRPLADDSAGEYTVRFELVRP